MSDTEQKTTTPTTTTESQSVIQKEPVSNEALATSTNADGEVDKVIYIIFYSIFISIIYLPKIIPIKKKILICKLLFNFFLTIIGIRSHES